MISDQQEALCAWLDERFCSSAVEIKGHIAGQFGLHYSHSGCLKLLRRLGLECRKPKSLPRVADLAVQAKFIAFYDDLMSILCFFYETIPKTWRNFRNQAANNFHII